MSSEQPQRRTQIRSWRRRPNNSATGSVEASMALGSLRKNFPSKKPRMPLTQANVGAELARLGDGLPGSTGALYG